MSDTDKHARPVWNRRSSSHKRRTNKQGRGPVLPTRPDTMATTPPVPISPEEDAHYIPSSPEWHEDGVPISSLTPSQVPRWSDNQVNDAVDTLKKAATRVIGLEAKRIKKGIQKAHEKLTRDGKLPVNARYPPLVRTTPNEVSVPNDLVDLTML